MDGGSANSQPLHSLLRYEAPVLAETLLQPPSLLLRLVGEEVLLAFHGDFVTPGPGCEQLRRAGGKRRHTRSQTSEAFVTTKEEAWNPNQEDNTWTFCSIFWPHHESSSHDSLHLALTRWHMSWPKINWVQKKTTKKNLFYTNTTSWHLNPESVDFHKSGRWQRKI